jgi:hypothetical protein
MTNLAKPTSSKTIESLIRTFELRARARRLESYGVLVVMLAILSGASFVFATARTITQEDTNLDLSSVLKAEESIQSTIEQSAEEVEKNKIALERLAYSLAYAIGQPVKVTDQSFKVLNLLNEAGQIKPKASIIDEIKQDMVEEIQPTNDAINNAASASRQGNRSAKELFEGKSGDARAVNNGEILDTSKKPTLTEATVFIYYNAILTDELRDERGEVYLKGISVPIKVYRKDLEAFAGGSGRGWNYDILSQSELTAAIIVFASSGAAMRKHDHGI